MPHDLINIERITDILISVIRLFCLNPSAGSPTAENVFALIPQGHVYYVASQGMAFVSQREVAFLSHFPPLYHLSGLS